MANRWKTDHKYQYQQNIQIQWNGKQFEIFLFFNVHVQLMELNPVLKRIFAQNGFK